MSAPVKLNIPVAYRKGMREFVDGRVYLTFEIDQTQVQHVKDLLDVDLSTPLALYIRNAAFPDGQQPQAETDGEESADPKDQEKELGKQRQKHIYRITRICQDELGWPEDYMRDFFEKLVGKRSRGDMSMAQLKKVREAVEEQQSDEVAKRAAEHEEEHSAED